MQSFITVERRALLLREHPLPLVSDPEVVRHCRTRTRPSSDKDPASRERTLDNVQFELLEALGDCYVEAQLGKAIWTHISRNEPEPSSALFACYRALLQSNSYFAQFALVYNLAQDMLPPIPATFDDRELLSATCIKSLGDAFEAHVGALVATGRAEPASEWLAGIFTLACTWAYDAAHRAAATLHLNFTRSKTVAADRMDTFSTQRAALATTSASVKPRFCGCWKRWLSEMNQRLSLRYDINSFTTHSTRLHFSNGASFEASAEYKKEADEVAALTAIRALDGSSIDRYHHFCRPAGDVDSSSEAQPSRDAPYALPAPPPPPD